MVVVKGLFKSSNSEFSNVGLLYAQFFICAKAGKKG